MGWSAGTENHLDVIQWDGNLGYFNLTNTPTFVSLSAVTFSAGTIYSGGTDLYDIFSTTDYYVTGFTYLNNLFTLTRNDGGSLSAVINTMTGLTVNGDLTVTGDTVLSATTATTLHTNLIHFNTGATTPVFDEGQMYWDENNQTVSLNLHLDGVSLQLGQESYYLIKNQSGATIENGKVIRADGTIGASGRILGKYMIADGSILGKYTLGLATQDIENGDDGYVTEFGLVRGVDTTGVPYGETWNDGDLLWVSPTIEGGLTNVQPNPPNIAIEIGIVVYTNANGSIFVRPHRYPYINDVQDIVSTGETQNDILQWNAAINAYQNTNTPTFTSMSSTTLSGGTIYSGGTDLYDIFSTVGGGSGDVTRVQPGTNIATGGTDNFPIISVVDSPSLNQLTTSGQTTIKSNLTVTGATLISGFLE
jgi:hypothetical protein